ncbi:MAG: carbon-nitrogen hydrolase family protein [Lachnospiraceae bacterium]|nr:carbon-nitrogen hydrolase family protein [Lachnospiraceae bacterium]
MKLGLCQMSVTADKEANLRKAEEMVREAAAQGAQLVVLPEMFQCPYANANFPLYAEEGEGESYGRLSSMARENGVTLVGGSIPERSAGGDQIYNTSYIFGPHGQLLGRHRKVHLFDVDVPGGIRFKESDTLTAGDSITVVDTPVGRIGVAICFDIRFAEMFRAMACAGAQILCVPAAFNMTTGPAHWELSFRMRAVDNQCFVAGCSPARDEKGSYVAYGHSIVTGPWGNVVAQADGQEQVVVAEVDLGEISRIRSQLPIMKEFM